MRASRFLFAAAALATSALAATAHASDLLGAIDEAYRAGEIDRAERLLYRVEAVRKPELLPARWQQLAQELKLGVRCATPVLAEAAQALPTLEPGVQSQLRDLLQPPPDFQYMVESQTPYPVRVTYANVADQTKAQQILDAVEYSFQKEVTEYGYWAPPIEPGLDFYRVFIDVMPPGAAAYTAPYAENDATAWTDMFSYIVVGLEAQGDEIEVDVAHEFNHACQSGMDVMEAVGFWENTATVVMTQVYPVNFPYTVYSFPYFQAQPWRPLEYMNMAESDGYEYGGALWALFLTRTYGNDQPQWLASVWEGAVQNGYDNEPDYFDVIDELTTAQGGIVEATTAFSEARWFVGDNDDGQHLQGAGDWWSCEPWVTATWTSASLPVLDQGPESADSRPQPNGCNYVELDLTTPVTVPVKFSFAGQASIPWDVRLLRTGGAAGTIAATIDVDAEGAGELSASADDADHFVLMICQRPDAEYDPDDQAWTSADYRYSIELDVAPPTVTSVDPAELEQGAHDVELAVHGTGFIQGTGLAVTASGTKVNLVLEQLVSPTELLVRAVASPDAELGPRDITVTNPNGDQGVGLGLLTIVEPSAAAPAPPATEEDSGCGCRVAATRRSAAPWGFAFGLGALAAVRARRAGRRRVARRSC